MLASERRIQPAVFDKRADASDFLGQMGSAFKTQPELMHALAGAGIGAGVGGVGQAIMNRDGKKRSLLSSMLTGGLTGAAIGGGAGMIRRGLGGLNSSGSTPASGGSYIDPETGQKMEVDPQAFKDVPGLGDKVRSLSKGLNPADSTLKAVGGNLWNTATRAIPGLNPLLSRAGLTYGEGDTFADKYLPTSSKVLPVVGALDALSHTNYAGERLGAGRIRPKFTNNPEHLAEGLAEFGPKHRAPQELTHAMLQRSRVAAPGNPSGLDFLGKDRMINPPGDSFLARIRNRLFGSLGDDASEVLRHPSDSGGMTRGQAQALKAEGYAKLEGKAPLNRFGPWQRTAPSLPKRIGGRAALYGGLPALEYILRASNEDKSRQEELRQLMAQYAKPAGGR